MSNSVLQQWVENIPWKQQSILFSSLRGPDQDFLKEIKRVSRWMRSVSQNNADPSKPYMMNGNALPLPTDLDKELEHCTCHFVHHFADGLAVIAYHHPDKAVAEYAAAMHFHIAEEIFHFVPESRETFLLRHRDKRGGIDHQKDEWDASARVTHYHYMYHALVRFDSVTGIVEATCPECKNQAPVDAPYARSGLQIECGQCGCKFVHPLSNRFSTTLGK